MKNNLKEYHTHDKIFNLHNKIIDAKALKIYFGVKNSFFKCYTEEFKKYIIYNIKLNSDSVKYIIKVKEYTPIKITKNYIILEDNSKIDRKQIIGTVDERLALKNK